MNASKENARKANADLEEAARLVDKIVANPASQEQIKRCLLRVQNFVEAAERKLPKEESFNKDCQRGKK